MRRWLVSAKSGLLIGIRASPSELPTRDKVVISCSPVEQNNCRNRRSACWRGVSAPGATGSGRCAPNLSKPTRRATSSIKSTSRCRSWRRDGGVMTSQPSFVELSSQPRAVKHCSMALSARSTGPEPPSIGPNNWCSASRRSTKGEGVFGPSPPTQRPLTRQANCSLSRSIARSEQAKVISDGKPFSKRLLASVRNPTALDDWRTRMGENMADSNQIFVVESRTALSRLPITPAIAMAWSWQVTTWTRGSRLKD